MHTLAMLVELEVTVTSRLEPASGNPVCSARAESFVQSFCSNALTVPPDSCQQEVVTLMVARASALQNFGHLLRSWAPKSSNEGEG